MVPPATDGTVQSCCCATLRFDPLSGLVRKAIEHTGVVVGEIVNCSTSEDTVCIVHKHGGERFIVSISTHGSGDAPWPVGCVCGRLDGL